MTTLDESYRCTLWRSIEVGRVSHSATDTIKSLIEKLNYITLVHLSFESEITSTTHCWLRRVAAIPEDTLLPKLYFCLMNHWGSQSAWYPQEIIPSKSIVLLLRPLAASMTTGICPRNSSSSSLSHDDNGINLHKRSAPPARTDTRAALRTARTAAADRRA